MIVCICKRVNTEQIEAVLEIECTLECVQTCTKACTECMSCEECIREMIEKVNAGLE